MAAAPISHALEAHSFSAGGAQPPAVLGLDVHLTRYLSTAEGSADLLDAVQTVAQYVKALPLTFAQLDLAESFRSTVADGRSTLILLKIFGESFKLYHKTAHLLEVVQLPTSDARPAEIGVAAKRVVVQGADLANAASEGALFLHQKKWVDLGGALPWTTAVLNASTLLADGIDAYDQWTGIEEIQWQRADTGADAHLDAREWLCIVRLVKDIASIILSVIGLGLLIFEIVMDSVALLPPLILGLSTLFLVCKIYAYFYERACVEAIQPRRAAVAI